MINVEYFKPNCDQKVVTQKRAQEIVKGGQTYFDWTNKPTADEIRWLTAVLYCKEIPGTYSRNSVICELANGGLSVAISDAQEVEANSIKLRTEWTDREFSKVTRCIFEFYKGQALWNHLGEKTCITRIENVESFFGLGYTSTGDYAAYWNTNSNIEHAPDQWIRGFALSINKQVVMLCLAARETTENWYVIGAIK